MANTPPYSLVCTDTGYGGNWDCRATGFAPNQTYTLSFVTRKTEGTKTIQADRSGNIRYIGGPDTVYSIMQGARVLAFFDTTVPDDQTD